MSLFVASLLIFVALNLLPGDVAQAILGTNADPEALAALREQLGLNRPAPLRYLDWLGHVLIGDFGQSALSGQAVA
ncbi:MAG TPA: ABC transporter permease, partial [Propionibacteriaceae bacterium]|nr:ABC transporter permease [Propionibacteriaceae bacterium]